MEGKKKLALEGSVSDALLHYELEGVEIVKVESLAISEFLDAKNQPVDEDCLEDCHNGSFTGNGRVRRVEDEEENLTIESFKKFSGNFNVLKYNASEKLFVVKIIKVNFVL